MYMLPAPSSATSPAPQKPAEVAGPPSPSSVPPPATLIIIPTATSGAPVRSEGSERDKVELSGLTGFAGALRFSSPPQATTTTDMATIRNASSGRRTKRSPVRRLRNEELSSATIVVFTSVGARGELSPQARAKTSSVAQRPHRRYAR
jgi:hypothetical protein